MDYNRINFGQEFGSQDKSDDRNESARAKARKVIEADNRRSEKSNKKNVVDIRDIIFAANKKLTNEQAEKQPTAEVQPEQMTWKHKLYAFHGAMVILAAIWLVAKFSIALINHY